MADIKRQNEDFKNFLIHNSKIIKEQEAEFVNSVCKIAELLNDKQVTAILEDIKND